MRGQTKHAFYRQVLSVHALPCSSVLVRGRFKEEEKTDHERTRTDKTRTTRTETRTDTNRQNTDGLGQTKHGRTLRDMTNKTRMHTVTQNTDGIGQTKYRRTQTETDRQNTGGLGQKTLVFCQSVCVCALSVLSFEYATGKRVELKAEEKTDHYLFIKVGKK